MLMRKPFIFCCVTLMAITLVCFGQGKPAKAGKSAANESTIIDLEKAVTEAFKNKQADAFRKYLAPEFVSIDAEGIENVAAQTADMGKYDVRENSFSDMKVVFPSPKIAVVTYKVTTQATHSGQDTSGTYNVGSVWTKHHGNWLLIFHAFTKAQ